MSDLDQFCQEIEIAGSSLKNCCAYKMDAAPKKGESNNDNIPSMRKFVGLGECNCCDYFRVHENSIVLIEETRLVACMRYCKADYPYLNDRDKDNVAIKRIREEMRLKAYGSMLVLCRLIAKSNKARDLVRSRKYVFWLVASNMDEDAKRAFDNLKDDLLSMLKSVLGKEVMDDVELLPADILKKRLDVATP